MILENEKCHIKIGIDWTYTVDSADNRYYDVVHNPEHYCQSDAPRTLSIHIDLFMRELRIALIGSYYTYDSECAVLDGEVLTVLQNDAVTQIHIRDGSIIRHIRFKCYGCNFAIYKVEKGYIIYGEMEITMLDFDLIKKWSFSGKDIFVSFSGKTTPFELRENSILLCDFEDNRYEIDFDGKEIM